MDKGGERKGEMGERLGGDWRLEIGDFVFFFKVTR